MSYVPYDEIKEAGGITMAPMIDFLFLMMAIFASLAVSRIVMRDTDIELVQSHVEDTTSLAMSPEYKMINITVDQNGRYKWVTDIRDHSMETADEIAAELESQYAKGLLPEDKLKTQVLLKIDREAKWEPILKVLLSVRESGFEIRPVYEPE
ncbi:MAG: biopolymer transporter ExbD [Chlamydiales bacterium]|nr:biopolymer transporter ExbD [Chlamydiales bacterium]